MVTSMSPSSGETPQARQDVRLHLRAGATSLLLDFGPGTQLPAVVHWGSDLGPLDADLAHSLTVANTPLIGINCVDEPVRLSLPVEARGGFTGRPGLSGSRAGRSWSPAFGVTSIAVNGQAINGFHEDGPCQVAVTAADAEACLELTLHLELSDCGLLRMRAQLTNTGAEYTLDDLVLTLPVPDRAGEILDLAGRWGRERSPQRAPFAVGTHLREGRKGRTGADAATVLHVGTPGFNFADGEIWAVHTAWSGNHTHYAELTFDGNRVIGGGELLLPGEVRLGTGEHYTSPWLYAVYGRGLDEIARHFHTFLRSRDNHVGWHRPITLNVWEAVYFDHDLDRLLDLADRAAALGVERYVLDDGWFGARRNDLRGLGDWTVSPDVWPKGLHPLVNRVRERGMEFGLWFEPEMINEDSDLARAHPEWIMAARAELPVESRHQQVLNLAIPECYDNILGQILAILDEYDIGYLKWDHNRDLIEAGTRPDDGRAAVHGQTEALYRMLETIKKAHPGLEIESCSSGGARVDLGILSHTDRVWVSDCIDPLERQQMMRWTTQLLPPELLGSHIASGRSHTTGRTHDLNFRAATAVFGHLGIEWDLIEASDRALAELAAWIEFYKANRELLLTGDLVRMDEPGDGFLVHGVVSPDKSRAIFALVEIASPLADPGPRLRFRHLDPETVYRVAPVLVGAAPSGLVPPIWWGGEALRPVPQLDPDNAQHTHLAPQAALTFPGASFTGSQLMAAGVRPPRLHPDQAVLFSVDAQTERRASSEG